MINSDSIQILRRSLGELEASGALELQIVTDYDTSVYIPYMMNDALEYYFILNHCRLTGYDGDISGSNPIPAISASLQSTENENFAVIIHKNKNEVFTVWFEELSVVRRCYQYHRIGHFWVSGQEPWRRLVYIIGTLYEKYKYVGASVCNEQEQKLLPLMEFAPFRRWFPYQTIPDGSYPDTDRAIQYMKELALEAGDRFYAELTDFYGKFCRNIPVPWLIHPFTRFLSWKLTDFRRLPLYQLIEQRIQTASKAWPVRDYGPEQNTEMEKQRRLLTESLQKEGFTGQYPLFFHESKNVQIFAMEEHPFTILDSDDFPFRIQLMVSTCTDKGQMKFLNFGFFRKKGNRGQVMDLNSLKQALLSRRKDL